MGGESMYTNEDNPGNLKTRISCFTVVSSILLSILSPLTVTGQVTENTAASVLEEIVVTARKREENLQDTPVAISAFSGEALEFRGVTKIDRLADFTPNLVLRASPTNAGVTNASAYIRGVGHNDFSPGVDPGVGVYVDGVYLGRSVGALLDTVDIDRIEVLRGPQGTLFGRNTIGGAINIHTKRPDDELGGSVDVRFGTDSRLNVRGTLNVPVSDELSTRFSIASLNQDGYVHRINDDNKDLGDDDTIVARFSARWVPSDALEVNFSGDYSRDRENGSAQVLTGVDPLATMVSLHNIFFDGTGTFNPFTCFGAANAANPNCYNEQWISTNRDSDYGEGESYANLDVWGGAITIDWDVQENFHVRSISSYRNSDGEFNIDRDSSPLLITNVHDLFEQEQYTQELQLLGNAFDNKLEWILGFYYFHEEGEDINPVEFSAVDLISGMEFESESWAVFGHGTYNLNDQLSVTVGFRYTEDDKEYSPNQTFTRLPLSPFGIFFPCLEPVLHNCEVGDLILPLGTTKVSANEFVPMANISYRWNDNLLTYFTYSEGFKSGGATQRIFPPEPSLPTFNPEFVESYEIGFKFEGWDDRLRMNIAAFYTDYKDLQLLVSGPPRIGAFIETAGEAEIKGVEVELSVRPADGWLISASAGYIDPEFTELAVNPDGTPRVPNITLDSRFEHISEWTGNAQMQKEIFLGEWGTLTPRVEWVYRTDYFTNDNNFNVPELFQDDYHLANISARWDFRNTGVSVTGGVDNAGDKNYRVTGSYQAGFGQYLEVFDRGRQWYVNLNYSF